MGTIFWRYNDAWQGSDGIVGGFLDKTPLKHPLSM